MARLVLLCAVVAGCSDEPKSSTQPARSSTTPEASLFRELSPDAPFHYGGAVFKFPPASVDALTTGGIGPFARLKPQGSTERFDYFVELGRPGTAEPRAGIGGRIGFWYFGPKAVPTRLANGYTLWCEPEEGERGSCAVLLREAPLAALLFAITHPPTDDQAIAAVAVSEAYLKRAKQP